MRFLLSSSVWEKESVDNIFLFIICSGYFRANSVRVSLYSSFCNKSSS